MTKCQLCKNTFKVISNTHLLAIHNITAREYIQKFGHKGVGFTVNISMLSKSDLRYKKWVKSLEGRNTAWARGHTKATHPSLAKMVETFRVKKIENFKKWREKARLSGKIPINYPALTRDKSLAFLVGMVLGDGNIYKFPRTEGLRIVLAAKYPGLIEYTKNIVKEVFDKKPNVRKVKGSECFTVTIYQNNISKRLGIPTGDKGRLKFTTPKWIFKNKEFLTNFLRGLFEAEGSFSTHKPTCTYNLAFSNKNPYLLNEVEEAMKLFGYHPERRKYAVRLRRKKEAYDFIDLIQFRKYN